MLSAMACLRSDVMSASRPIVIPGEAGIALAVGDGGAGLHGQTDVPDVQHRMAVDQLQKEAQRLFPEPRMVADPVEIERLERLHEFAGLPADSTEGFQQLGRR